MGFRIGSLKGRMFNVDSFISISIRYNRKNKSKTTWDNVELFKLYYQKVLSEGVTFAASVPFLHIAMRTLIWYIEP